jgi:hypothetical protein
MLRWDWSVAAAVGLCFLHRKHHGLAGMALAWSVLTRLFPMALVGMLGLKALSEIDYRRGVPWQERVPVRYLRFGAGFVGVVAVVVALTVVTGGTSQYKKFAANISVHTSEKHVSFQRVGLPIAVTFRGELEAPEGDWFGAKKKALKRVKPYLLFTALLLCVAAFFLAREMDDDEAIAFGLLFFFVPTVASYYYYVITILLALLHLGRLRELKHVVGLAILLGLPLLTFVAHHFLQFRYAVTGLMSVYLAFYFLYLISVFAVPALLRAFRRRKQPMGLTL